MAQPAFYDLNGPNAGGVRRDIPPPPPQPRVRPPVDPRAAGHGPMPMGGPMHAPPPPRDMVPVEFRSGPSRIQEVGIEFLSDNEIKKDLYEYAVFRFEKLPSSECDDRGRPVPPSWNKAIQTQVSDMSQDQIMHYIQKLDRTEAPVTDKKKCLDTALQRQLDTTQSTLMKQEPHFSEYQWVLIQMDHQLRELGATYTKARGRGYESRHSRHAGHGHKHHRHHGHGTKYQKKKYMERLSLTAFFRRQPRDNTDLRALWNQKRFRNVPPYPTGNPAMGVQMPMGMPPQNQQQPFDPNWPKDGPSRPPGGGGGNGPAGQPRKVNVPNGPKGGKGGAKPQGQRPKSPNRKVKHRSSSSSSSGSDSDSDLGSSGSTADTSLSSGSRNGARGRKPGPKGPNHPGGGATAKYAVRGRSRSRVKMDDKGGIKIKTGGGEVVDIHQSHHPHGDPHHHHHHLYDGHMRSPEEEDRRRYFDAGRRAELTDALRRGAEFEDGVAVGLGASRRPRDLPPRIMDRGRSPPLSPGNRRTHPPPVRYSTRGGEGVSGRLLERDLERMNLYDDDERPVFRTGRGRREAEYRDERESVPGTVFSRDPFLLSPRPGESISSRGLSPPLDYDDDYRGREGGYSPRREWREPVYARRGDYDYE